MTARQNAESLHATDGREPAEEWVAVPGSGEDREPEVTGGPVARSREVSAQPSGKLMSWYAPADVAGGAERI